MFTIRDYRTPNQYKFVTLRSERIRKAKRAERVATLARRTLATLAIVTLILAISYVGEQDRQYELISNGGTAEKASK
mgnify:CR=1 FL=1